MFFKQLQRKPVVTLRQRAVAHHVGEHDRGQFALFDIFGRHERIKPECVRKEMTNLPRSVYHFRFSVDLQLGADSCDAKEFERAVCPDSYRRPRGTSIGACGASFSSKQKNLHHRDRRGRRDKSKMDATSRCLCVLRVLWLIRRNPIIECGVGFCCDV